MLEYSDLSRSITQMEYAVRGPIVQRAQELEKEGREIIYCNIGNPQALKQKPISYFRQVLALCEYPELLKEKNIFPSDVIEVAKKILKESKHGLGAYSESAGFGFVREAVANFISKRDEIDSNPDSIFLTDGASKSAQSAMRLLLTESNDGMMIPIPQYPLYSATITFFGGKQVGYYLDEGNNWKLNKKLLEDSLAQAKRSNIRVRSIAVINPGNPTGSVLDYENISMVIDFAKEHNLTIIADEVYQENIYNHNEKFISFAKVLDDKKIKDVTLFSLNSASKGFLGECGHRGGYVECRNISREVSEQLLKLQSVSLCSNVPGQIVTYLLVSPPQKGSPSYELYQAEKMAILNELKAKAEILAAGLNRIKGISSNPVAGSMYAFPEIKLPKGKNDFQYCMDLLEKTGICVVPGSGFGQRPDTTHLRTTILPPRDKMEEFLKKLEEFHSYYCASGSEV